MIFGWFWLIFLGIFLATEAFHLICVCLERPAPKRRTVDWEHVYAIEREVWGQTFEHAGAPAPKPRGYYSVFGQLMPIEDGETLAQAKERLSQYNPFSNPKFVGCGIISRSACVGTSNRPRPGVSDYW